LCLIIFKPISWSLALLSRLYQLNHFIWSVFLAFSLKFKGNYGRRNTATTKRLNLQLLLPDFPGFVFQTGRQQKPRTVSKVSWSHSQKVGISIPVGVGV